MGLWSLLKLARVTIHDEWQRNDRDQQRVVLDPVALRPLHLSSSPLARSWNPLFLNPSPWGLSEGGRPEDPHGYKQYQAMIRALSISKTCISDLRICPRSRNGIPSYVFDSSDSTRYSPAISTASINVFSDPTSLNLKIVFSAGEELIGGFSGATLPDLTKLLASIHDLVNLAIAFLWDDCSEPHKIFDLKDIFGPFDQYSWDLCSLHLCGLSTTQSDLQDFLTLHADVEHLSLADFELLDGDWATMLDKIKALSLTLKEFGLLESVTQWGGVDIVSSKSWTDHALATRIPQYVLNKDGG